MSKVLYYAIFLILMFGIYGAGRLSYRQFHAGDICPELLGIPACYIILACFLIPFFAQLFELNQVLFFTGTILAWSIAAYGTTTQLMGTAECPKTSNGTPMCFISLAIFTSLILLKIAERSIPLQPLE
ncbi:hypothetical protein [Neolewinella persica]|uniref:hypothetical protein n=1 Tax=Neolewinella persica TaxID=70998 RepID=UPI000379AE59|nr:hypothetical protein [Neolewinella persica]